MFISLNLCFSFKCPLFARSYAQASIHKFDLIGNLAAALRLIELKRISLALLFFSYTTQF